MGDSSSLLEITRNLILDKSLHDYFKCYKRYHNSYVIIFVTLCPHYSSNRHEAMLIRCVTKFGILTYFLILALHAVLPI